MPIQPKIIPEVMDESMLYQYAPLPIEISRLADLQILKVNAAYLDFFGLSQEQVFGKTVGALGFWVVPKRHADLIAEIKNQRVVKNFSAECRTASGVRMALLISAVLVEYNNEAHLISTFIPAPDAVLQREKRQESEKNLALLRNASDGIHILDFNGYVIEASDSFCNMLGYRHAEIIGMHASVWEAKYAPSELADLLQQLFAKPERSQFNTRHRCKDGRYLDVEISCLRLVFDGKPVIFCSSRDITERNKTSMELEQHRLHLEELVQKRTAELQNANDKLLDTLFAMESVGIGIYWLNSLSGRFIYVNKFSADMLGYSVDEMLMLSIFDIDPNFSEAEFFITDKKLRQEGHIQFESFVRAKDARLIPVEINLFYLPAKAEDPALHIAFLTDISKRKQAESVMLRAKESAEEASKAKSAFLANMSHEIRTPMHAVLGFCYLLEQQAMAENARELVAKIQSAGLSLLAIINDILDFSKIEAGHLHIEYTPFRLSDILEQLTALMKTAAECKNLELRIIPPPVLHTLIGDPLRLQQILLNLLSNAIKFTDAGQVELRISILSQQDQQLQMRFAVRDTGIGISKEQQQLIFSPFSQADNSISRRFGGTGLGLAICQQLVKLMNGEFHLSSVMGEGSLFWFDLPLRANPLQTWPPATEHNQAIHRTENCITTRPKNTADLQIPGLRVLVVDDSEINREVALHILEANGAIVHLANDGLQALQWLAKHTDDVDVVLMDIQMPNMDGYAAIRQIRLNPQWAQLPVLALTAGAFDNLKQAALDAGMNDFIPKPFNVDDLIASIRHWSGIQPLTENLPATGAEASAPVSATPLLAAEAAPQQWPGIDLEAALRIWGQSDLYQNYLSRFLKEYAAAGLDIANLAQRGEFDSIAALTHKIKGAASGLGLMNVAERCINLETLLRSHELLGAPALTLQAALQEVNASFAAWRTTTALPGATPNAAKAKLNQAETETLLVDLLAALDADNPEHAEPILANLEKILGPSVIEPLKTAVQEFDFRQAELLTRGLLETLK